MRENQLNELQGTSILTKSFFNRLIRRIECTKPIAGDGIEISEKDNGFQISTASTAVSGFTPITLNVCSGLDQIRIEVLGRILD
jgi:hypothetical protein